ncbi:MAG: pyridoxal phosphate-dependent aminotransferase family protein, partial [Nitrospinae bacterium]|nr:pyridoxal phosphate-dependent aminotransferase family protein [Nitrospinota bacterium]
FLPPYQAGVALASIDIVQQAQDKRLALRSLSRWLREELSACNLTTGNFDTPIVPVLIGEAEAALELQERCRKKGIFVGAVRPPTVPRGTSRLRVSLHSELTPEQLAPFISVIKEWQAR